MKAKYYLQIDILKAFAIIAVIVMYSYTKLTTIGVSTVTTSTGLNSLNTSIIQINHITLIGIIESFKVFSLWQAIPIFFVLMGITMGMSFKRHNYTNLREICSKDYFKSRFIRLYFPYLLLLLFSVILGLLIFLFTNVNPFGNLSIWTLIGFFPLQGPNYGSYFVVLLLEFIFVFPVIYVLYRKNPKITLISAVLIDLIFQTVAYSYMNFSGYDICIIRFISALTIGLWISDQDFNNSFNVLTKSKNFLLNNEILVILSVIGIFYLTIWYFFYSGYLSSSLYPLPYFNHNLFGCQNVFSFVYTAVLIILGFIIFPTSSKSKILNKLGLIGKASYHIFFVQILYFLIFSLSTIINKSSLINKLLIIMGDVVLCTILGILFYYLEQKISSIVFRDK